MLYVLTLSIPALLILFVSIIIVAVSYKSCPPGHMVLIYKKSCINDAQKKPLKKIEKISKKFFVFPLLYGCITILEGPIVFGIDLLGAMSKDKEPINVQFIYTIEFSKNSDIVNAAIKNIARYNMKKLLPIIKSQIADTLYKEVLNFPVKDIGNDNFQRTINIAVHKKLNELGFELKDVKVKLLRNDEMK